MSENDVNGVSIEAYEALLKQYQKLERAANEVLEGFDKGAFTLALPLTKLRLAVKDGEGNIKKIDDGVFDEEQSE